MEKTKLINYIKTTKLQKQKIDKFESELELLKIKRKNLKKKKKNVEKQNASLEKEKTKVVKTRAKKIKKIISISNKITKDPKFKEEQYILNKIKEFNSNGKPTIAYFNDSFYPLIDGVINVLNNSALEMMKTCNVVVCVPKHKRKIIQREYLVLGANSTYLKFINQDMAQPGSDIKFNRYIKMLKIDIVHIHSSFFMGMYGVKIAKNRNIPLYSTFHCAGVKKDIENEVQIKSVVSMIMNMIMKPFNACDIVFTMHEAAKQVLISYGYKGKIELLPNGTDHICPTNILERKEIMDKKYNIKNNEFVFLFVGRLVAVKNIMFIAKSLSLLKQKGIKFKMFFVGNGPDEDKLKEKIEELSLQDEVVLTGKITSRDELANYYLRADLFLFPSTYDTSSIVQIESACYHTPAVFIEGSTTSCTVTNNRNGFLAKNSEESFAERICEIISKPKLLKKVSETAHKELYVTWQEICKRLYNYYFPKQKKSLFKKLKNIQK